MPPSMEELKDRLIKENPSLARELKRNQTANIYLSKGN